LEQVSWLSPRFENIAEVQGYRERLAKVEGELCVAERYYYI
jgi:hypothetical protein